MLRACKLDVVFRLLARLGRRGCKLAEQIHRNWGSAAPGGTISVGRKHVATLMRKMGIGSTFRSDRHYRVFQ